MVTAPLSRLVLSFLVVSGSTACWLTGPSDQEELTAAIARWEASGLTDYEFTLAYTSMAGYRATRIRVLAGQVVKVTPLQGSASTQPGGSGTTISELFQDIRSIIESRPDWFRARYDPALGYPRSVDVDRNRDALDDEWGFSITDFQELPQ